MFGGRAFSRILYFGVQAGTKNKPIFSCLCLWGSAIAFGLQWVFNSWFIYEDLCNECSILDLFMKTTACPKTNSKKLTRYPFKRVLDVYVYAVP